MSNKSPVEQFWNAISGKFGVTVEWNNLHPMHQQMIIQGINTVLSVVQQVQAQETRNDSN